MKYCPTDVRSNHNLPSLCTNSQTNRLIYKRRMIDYYLFIIFGQSRKPKRKEEEEKNCKGNRNIAIAPQHMFSRCVAMWCASRCWTCCEILISDRRHHHYHYLLHAHIEFAHRLSNIVVVSFQSKSVIVTEISWAWPLA